MSLLDECPKHIFFFQLPTLNKYCFGVELAPAHQVIKKLRKAHLWVYTRNLAPHAAMAAECDKKKGYDVHWNSEYMYFDREINFFKKFHVKIKLWLKVIVHKIRGRNFWDRLIYLKVLLQKFTSMHWIWKQNEYKKGYRVTDFLDSVNTCVASPNNSLGNKITIVNTTLI